MARDSRQQRAGAHRKRPRHGSARFAVAIAAAISSSWIAGPVRADEDDGPGNDGVCEDVAMAQYRACRNEVRDDFQTAKAICLNGPEEDLNDCLEEAREGRSEGKQGCREQLDAREDLCDALGGGRYDPDFDPAEFDDPKNPTNPNPYFPLTVGNSWDFIGGDELVEIEVLDETKLIEGVTCIVVNDRVTIEGELHEDTDDWFGQRTDGTVDYCGESSRNYETFPGDDPPDPELVDVEGSWKAGVDGALAGTQFLAMPAVGDIYRQEWAPGDAEDAAEVLSTSYGFGSDPELDAFVPQELAELLCAANDCAVTGEFTPIEPDAFQRKYYARDIGLFLEVDPESGDLVQLVDCNFDARCAMLPAP